MAPSSVDFILQDNADQLRMEPVKVEARFVGMTGPERQCDKSAQHRSLPPVLRRNTDQSLQMGLMMDMMKCMTRQVHDVKLSLGKIQQHQQQHHDSYTPIQPDTTDDEDDEDAESGADIVLEGDSNRDNS
jgi:hypothetical protein